MDNLLKVTAASGQIRAVAAITTNLVDEARQKHDTYPTATAALGRVLTAGLLMGSTLADEDILTIRILGDGPLGAIIASTDKKGTIRGYVQEPHIDLAPQSPGKLDVGRAVGQKGYVHITKDIGLKEPYTGSAPLVNGEIAEDIANYFMQSEQVPSVVALGVLIDPDGKVTASGGYLVQLMPGAEEEIISQLEKNIANIFPVSKMVSAGQKPEDILSTVLHGLDMKIQETFPLSFECKCTRENLEKILISLGTEELHKMIIEDNGAELRCHFCNQYYHFTAGDLQKLIGEIKFPEG